MSDKRYFQTVAILATLVCLAGAANLFVASMTIDRVMAAFGIILMVGSWVIVRYCAHRLKAHQRVNPFTKPIVKR